MRAQVGKGCLEEKAAREKKLRLERKGDGAGADEQVEEAEPDPSGGNGARLFQHLRTVNARRPSAATAAAAPS